MIGTLLEKWDPRAPQPDDCRAENKENAQNREPTPGIKFNSTLATEGSLTDIFRIFTSGPVQNKTYKCQPYDSLQGPIVAFVKGTSKPYQNVTQGSLMGAGVTCVDRNDLDTEGKWFSLEQDPGGGGDLLAILLASMKVGIRTPLTLNIRLADTIENIMTKLKEKEDMGFLGSSNAGLLRTTIG